jgi:hypothetical protein
MGNATNIWGKLETGNRNYSTAFSVAFAEATGDVSSALEMLTGAAADEAAEKQFSGPAMSDDEWASL